MGLESLLWMKIRTRTGQRPQRGGKWGLRGKGRGSPVNSLPARSSLGLPDLLPNHCAYVCRVDYFTSLCLSLCGNITFSGIRRVHQSYNILFTLPGPTQGTSSREVCAISTGRRDCTTYAEGTLS